MSTILAARNSRTQMCGRYYLTTPPAQLMDLFGLTDSEPPIAPSLNIAPTEEVLVVTNVMRRALARAKWGLIPVWAKDPRIGSKMINARAEGIEEKPAFRTAVRKRRCLVLANGFYEWRGNPDGSKTPFQFSLNSGQPFAFAGLWETWRPPGMDPIRTCTIVTTDANDVVSPIHDRMPVILRHGDEPLWLEKDEDAFGQALALLRPYPDRDLVISETPAAIFATAGRGEAQLELGLGE